MHTKTKKIVVATVLATMLPQLTACGTILYPERQGRTGGQLDPAIVVMDGIGLLFFLVPGLVAFAVDFYTGAIYLSGGRHSFLTPEELQQVAPEGQLDQAELAKVLRAKGVIHNDADLHDLQAVSLASMDEVYARLSVFDVNYARANGTTTL